MVLIIGAAIAKLPFVKRLLIQNNRFINWQG
jgi:hypothetical protein